MISKLVAYARNRHRWEEPLDEVSISRYERRGFIWFEGFFNQERMMPFFDELKEMTKGTKLHKSDQITLDPNTGDIRSVVAKHELSDHFSRLT